MSVGTAQPPSVTVRLVHLPVDIHVRATSQQEALRREFEILLLREDRSSVPERLFSLIREVEEQFGGAIEAPGAELQLAIDRGEQTVDLEYQVPPDAGTWANDLLQILEEVDDYCRAGEHLLTLAAPPEIVLYRRWFLGQFVDQLSGAEPTPWDEFRARVHLEPEHGVAQSAGAATSEESGGEPYSIPEGWSVDEQAELAIVRPRGELDLQTAPQLRDLVLAVRGDHTASVELNLEDVSFIDSVGLSMIISAHQRLEADQVGLVVVVPSALQRLFEISGLGQLLELRIV